MQNSADFRADQIQVNKIIATGSNGASSEAILVYGVTNQTEPLNEGYIDPAKFSTGSIGSDVFFYVSGGIGGKDVPGGAISVIGGDLHVSGNFSVAGALSGTNIAAGGSDGQIQWNNAGSLDGLSVLTYDGMTLQGTGSFSGSFQGILDGTASYATNAGDASTIGGQSLSGLAQLGVSNTFTENNVFLSGLSGSLQKLSDGTEYLVAGPNIVVNTASNGQVSITGSVGGNNTEIQYNNNGLFEGVPSLTYNGSLLQATGSFSGSFQGTLQGTLEGTASYSISGSYSAYAANALSASYSDYAVSASFATTASFAANAALLDGQNLSAFPRLNIDNNFTGNNTFTTITASSVYSSGNVTVDGNLVANNGLTGSVHKTSDGLDFIIAGDNINLAYNASEQWEVSASASGITGEIQFNNAGKFATDSNLTFDVALKTLATVTGVFSRSVMQVAEIYPVDGNPVMPTYQTALMFTSGATSDLYFRHFYPPNGGNTTNFRWVENYLGTGLLAGGILSTETGTTTFNITAGSALIVSYNATTASEPDATIKRIEWPDYISQSLTYISSSPQTFVGIAPDSSVIQQIQPFTNTDFHDFIPLGRILHLEGGTTYGINETPRVSYGQTTWNGDFARAFGPLKISGHVLLPSGSTLSLVKTGGTSFVEGKNYNIDPNNPNLILPSSDGPVTVSKIFREYVSGADSSAIVIDTNNAIGYATIDPTLINLDNAGTLSAISGNKFSIQRVFWSPNSPTNALLVYYGPQQYDSIQEAQASIPSEIFVEGSNTLGACILVANIIVRKDCTDLTDTSKARIIQGGLFRGSGTGIGGAAGATLPGGLDTYIQFNDGGSTFGGSLNLTFNKTTNTFTTPNISTQIISASNAITSSGNLYVGGNTVVNTLTASNLNVTSKTVLNTVTASNLTVNGQFNATGPIIAFDGLSGSLQKLSDGSAYLVAGPNITVNTASNGQILITGSIGGVNTQLQYNNNGLFGGVSVLTYNGSALQGTGSFSGSFQGTLDGTASYASNAGNANTVGGQSLSGLAQLNVANTFTQNNVFTTASGSFSGSYQGNLIGTASYASNSDLLNGFPDTAFAKLNSPNTFTQNNVFTTATGSFSGSYQGNLTGTASYALTAALAENANLLDGLHSYQYAQLAANNTFAGNNIFQLGLSGSLQSLADGTPYLAAGPNITINTASNGQVSITGSIGGTNTQLQYNNNGLFGGVPVLKYDGTTLQASGAFSGSLTATTVTATSVSSSGNISAQGNLVVQGTTQLTGAVNLASSLSASGQISTANNLFVQGTAQITGAVNLANTLSASGQISTANNLRVQGTTQLTGAVNIGGQLTASNGLNLTGNSAFAAGSTFTFNGNSVFTDGLSGSLQKLSDGVTNYLNAGANITLNTASNGQVTISSTGGAAGGLNTQIQYNSSGALAGTDNLTYNGTLLQATGSFSGSFQGTFPSNIPLYSTSTAAVSFAFATTPGTATQTVNASYVKIGKLVTVFFSITFSATGTIGTGNVTLIGLPFTSKTQTGGIGTFTPAYFTNMNTSGPAKVTTMSGLVRSNSTIVDMYGIQSAGSETALDGGAILNNTTIAGTVTYFSAV